MAYCNGCGNENATAVEDGLCETCREALAQACPACWEWARWWEKRPPLKRVASRRDVDMPGVRIEGRTDWKCAKCGTRFAERYQYDAGSGSDNEWWVVHLIEEGRSGGGLHQKGS